MTAKNSANVSLLIASKAIQAGTALISIRLITEILTPSELGKHYIIITLITLLSFALLNPMGTLYGRFFFAWYHKNTLAAVTNRFLAIRLILVIPALIITVLISSILDYEDFFKLSALLPTVALLFFAQNSGFLLNAINLMSNVKVFAKYVIASSSLAFVFGLWLLYTFKNAYAWIIGAAIGQSLLIIPMYRNLRNSKLQSNLYAYTLPEFNITFVARFLAPVTITLFLQWFLSSSYRLFVEAR